MLSEAQKLYGTDEAPAAWRTLRAGRLSADLENGQLRYIRYDGVEVLRAISFLVRDRYWGTYAAELSGLTVEETAERFVVRYAGRCAPGAGDLGYEVEIVGEASGRLSFRASGAPAGELTTNRLGFVVLHPLDGVAGSTVVLEHTDGRRETAVLPERISPHEPVTDLFAITHRAQGLSVRVEMVGDAYDMEDQRNWTDASFKTYIRPLSKPWPYTVAAGERFEQSVTVSVRGAVVDAPVAAEVAAAEVVAPRIGLAVEPGDVAAVDAGRFGWVAELIGRPAVPRDVASIVALAERLGVPLELQFAIPAVDPVTELAAWHEAGRAQAALVVPWRLWPLAPAGERGSASAAEIVRAARAAFPGVRIGGGVLTGFTEFNRNRPPVETVDYLAHATTAIVHAADDRSVLESIEALPHVFGSAWALAGGLPYRVGPAGIGMALNPDGPPRRSDGGRATMVRNDPRQDGLFAAAWTLGYAVEVVQADVELFTPGFAVGDLGLVDGDQLRPVYHVVRALALAAGQSVRRIAGLPDGCVGLAFAGSRWIANLSPEAVTLNESGAAAVLDVDSFEAAATDVAFFDAARAKSVERLAPYAVARIWS
ncbi:MAG: hypothetical protein ACO1OG_08610 [Devosia sp.]